MNLVADAVAGPGKIDTVLGSNTLNISVVICILKPGLQSVVIDVRD